MGCILEDIGDDDRDIEDVDLTIAHNTTIALDVLSKELVPLLVVTIDEGATESASVLVPRPSS